MTKPKVSREAIRGEISKLRYQRTLLETHCLNIKRQLPAWLSFRYTYCRKGNCKCTKGHPHGPFAYIYFKRKGRTICRYVTQKRIGSIKPDTDKYHSFQQNLAQIRKINERINFLLKRWQRANLMKLPK